MYFSLCENMMCGVRAPWLVGHNKCKEGVQNKFAKGQLTLRLNQKCALEHATKTTANEQLAHTLRTCVRGNNSPYQPVAVVCICHLKRETGIARTVVACISFCPLNFVVWMLSSLLFFFCSLVH